MRNFLIGVAVGAVGMGFYTGNIRIDVSNRIKDDVEKVKTKIDDAADDVAEAVDSESTT
jgi:uncharacterized membrane-anchored protein YhcB (DUF1043 family)